MKELIEKRNAMLDELDAILAKAKEETRAFDEDELKKVEELKNEIRKIDDSIKAEEEVRGLEKKEVKTPETRSAEEIRAEVIAKEERDFVSFLRGETRTAGSLGTSGNGSVIPVSVATKIVDKVKNISPVLSLATIYDVKGDLVIPASDYTAFSAGYQNDLAQLTSVATNFSGVTLRDNIVGALTLISKSLINRADIDVVPFVVNELAKNIALFLESELVAGAGGAGKLNGLPTGTNTFAGGTTLVITAQELIKVQLSVPQALQAGSVWIMHPQTLAYIQGLTAGAGNNMLIMGNSLSEDAPFTLLGKPVYVSDQMPQIGVNAKEIFYGNITEALAIKFVNGVSMQVLQERFADQYAVGAVAYCEVDAAIVNQQALVAYVGK
jgi:HK97 family phage major capsid protein